VLGVHQDDARRHDSSQAQPVVPPTRAAPRRKVALIIPP
jgi:hypothetical protein